MNGDDPRLHLLNRTMSALATLARELEDIADSIRNDDLAYRARRAGDVARGIKTTIKNQLREMSGERKAP